ncbi:MAG: hypothetical protein U5L11_02310 [Arhodomonas sp.]|nr:hypothetical protein [Arhodomonas sp.]
MRERMRREKASGDEEVFDLKQDRRRYRGYRIYGADGYLRPMGHPIAVHRQHPPARRARAAWRR